MLPKDEHLCAGDEHWSMWETTTSVMPGRQTQGIHLYVHNLNLWSGTLNSIYKQCKFRIYSIKGIYLIID